MIWFTKLWCKTISQLNESIKSEIIFKTPHRRETQEEEQNISREIKNKNTQTKCGHS